MNLPVYKLTMFVVKQTDAYKNINNEVHILFQNMVELYEQILIMYLKTVKNEDIPKLMKQIDEFIETHEIDTTSKILYMATEREGVNMFKLEPEMQFIYRGFCPKKPVERLTNMNTFPYSRYEDELKKHNVLTDTPKRKGNEQLCSKEKIALLANAKPLREELNEVAKLKFDTEELHSINTIDHADELILHLIKRFLFIKQRAAAISLKLMNIENKITQFRRCIRNEIAWLTGIYNKF
jgi:hypothetical protein